MALFNILSEHLDESEIAKIIIQNKKEIEEEEEKVALKAEEHLKTFIGMVKHLKQSPFDDNGEDCRGAPCYDNLLKEDFSEKIKNIFMENYKEISTWFLHDPVGYSSYIFYAPYVAYVAHHYDEDFDIQKLCRFFAWIEETNKEDEVLCSNFYSYASNDLDRFE